MRGLVVVLVGLAGCWAEQRVDDTFSDSEWDYLQTFSIERLAPPASCIGRCGELARFGQQMFFDARYSMTGKVSCATCHVPARYFADPGKASSFGTGWTKRNVPGLIDLANRHSFTWNGEISTIDGVLALAINPAALDTDKACIEKHVATYYPVTYAALFDRGEVFDNVALALATYESNLRAGPTPFDRYLAGDSDAISSAAKRGAKVFIGKGLCSECHRGPMFADDLFHVTGVAQHNEHVPDEDVGRGGTGQFRTPTLRHVAMTAPYMHAGQHETLDDVVAFYRWGGDAGGFVGEKEARMRPLDLADEDVADLIAFMTTLTGELVDPQLARAPALPNPEIERSTCPKM